MFFSPPRSTSILAIEFFDDLQATPDQLKYADLRSFSDHMGLLDQLWDDTVAGPRPDNGLGKLRKHSIFTSRPNSAKESDGGSVSSYGDETPGEATRVTRSIMIVKPPGYQTGSPPVSPAGSTPPVSPFSESRFDFGEGRHRTLVRRLTKLDREALVLLMTSEI
ncbi:dormancy-associated protein homolog 3-like isoform X2 [Hibiscus syriacus]|uniref:dormancy-associated protein homolog 3-like isoform X2 n=1 Tax=Hibiscus syriacus TaxID=106335 RepID=UPI001921BEDF|nr:dormancy-associated protein homolog 3-like isoform X2 [Hibiscus syriacus]